MAIESIETAILDDMASTVTVGTENMGSRAGIKTSIMPTRSLEVRGGQL